MSSRMRDADVDESGNMISKSSKARPNEDTMKSSSSTKSKGR
jgi:hypothetical protein